MQDQQGTIEPATCLPLNPHCVPRWPENAFNADQTVAWHHLAALRRDIRGAAGLASLLRVDDQLAEQARDSRTPAEEPQPFTPNAHADLMLALETCLASANGLLEWIEEHDRASQAA